MSNRHDRPARLITIPPSNDCEIARWLLELCRVPFDERAHAPVIHELVLDWYGQRREKRRQIAALRAAGDSRGPQTYPLLVGDGRKLWNVRQLLADLVERSAEAEGLLPDGGTDELWRLCKPLHDDFTAHPAVWYYTLVLPHRRLTTPCFVAGVPWIERELTRIAYPLIAAAIRHVGKLDDDRARQAAAAISATFEDVAERMRDGRQCLCGDRFTLVDLVFAASAAPIVAVDGYGATPAALPEYADLPAAMRHQIDAWRRHPTGQYVLRVYREHRRSTTRSAAARPAPATDASRAHA